MKGGILGAGWDFGGRLGSSVKFTFRADPLQKGFRGTLGCEVNFTGRGYPCQKYLRGRLAGLVKFTFRANPLQKALRGIYPSKVERLCVHLGVSPPLQYPQRHIGFRGEFHRSGLPLSEVPLGQVGMFREIHLSG